MLVFKIESLIFRSECSLTHRRILLSRIVHYEMSIERDLSRYENTNNIIYHLLRVECNTFANWIHLKIFSRASKNIFTKKTKENMDRDAFILIHFHFLYYDVRNYLQYDTQDA